ncbi:FAD dependent oxidoreductase [Penicillium maclennaniae]|uniref:FAD dependent oxidoreductase n=1 Tax=Penicillium maclennaniae TaxID=1343394 RepID=UPI002541B72A|nr:FAD dependent oxidoreductase [Penicillium maclennaniae]KAJ5670557.1 FAD dependent oxidoreductase [Penicillium maclennaniae]
MESEILIVGAGIFGISTAYHLAKRSSRSEAITVLDRCSAPSQDAASTDINKIIRADYSSSLYMELGLEAIEMWKNDPLFKDSGVYHQTGWIMMDEKDSDLAGRIGANFRRSIGFNPLQPLSEDEVRSKWDGVLKDTDLSPFGSFFLNPLAGWADAGRALTIMTNEVISLGVRYRVDEATRLVLGEDGIKGVQTESGELYSANKVLLCTGAWTSQLMNSLEIELEILESDRVETQATAAGVCVAHFQLSDAERKLYDQLPVRGHTPDQCRTAQVHHNAVIQKHQSRLLGATGLGLPIHNPTHCPEKLQKECIDSIRPRLPQLFTSDRHVDYFRLCWDAITPDQHPLITQHPDTRLRNLYLAIGGSFHCWKFLPTIGRYVANMLEGKSNRGDRDDAWAWKKSRQGGVHDSLRPSKELSEYY